LSPTTGRTQRDGVDLVWWEWPGGEPPALLLHGIANYGRYWDLFAREIAGRLRLIAPDARGHGDSGKPVSGYEPEEFVADALAVLDAARVDRAVVVAHSMGGAHAMLLAARHPERVRSLVLVDVGPENMREGSERARRLTQERPASFAGREEALAYLRRTSPGYGDEVYGNRLDHAFRDDDGRLAWRSSPAALALIRAARSGADERWQALREITCPLVVVRGTRSKVLSAETAEKMKTLRPDIQLALLDAGHNVALDRPRELAEIVVRASSRPWSHSPCPARHAWCIWHRPVTSAAHAIRRIPRKRSTERAAAGALVAYGAVGLLIVAALGASVAPALSTLDALAGSSADVEKTLATTRDAFDTFGASLVDGRRSAQQAAVTARSSAATARQLADAMAVSIFGAQPLLGLSSGFRQQATDITGLASDLDALAAALSRDERDVRAIRDQVAVLHDRTVLIASSQAASLPLAQVLYLALLWVAAQSAAAVWIGVLLWRRTIPL
jgi:pimeloyl-ACP methyl ester carboxylesterase